MFICDCGSAYENRIAVVGECTPSIQKRENSISMIGGIEGCERETYEFWEYETKAIAVVGDINWREQARVEIDRVCDHFSGTVGSLGKSD